MVSLRFIYPFAVEINNKGNYDHIYEITKVTASKQTHYLKRRRKGNIQLKKPD